MADKKPKDTKPKDKPDGGGKGKGKGGGTGLGRWIVRLIVLAAVYVASFFLMVWVSRMGWLDGVPYAKQTLRTVYFPLDFAYHEWARPALEAGTKGFGR